MPHTKAWYVAKDSEVDGLGLVHSDARSEARKLGYDSGQFNCTIVRVNSGPRLDGISWGGGDSVWVSWDGMDVLDHECGHSLGRNHANFWQTSDGSAIGVGANQEYGNSFDVMGGGSGFGAHYNAISKRALGWLTDAHVHRPPANPAANGVYRIFAYDQPQLEEGRRYALLVDKDPQRRFNLEYHPAMGGKLPDSVLMILSGLGSNAGHLVDTTPGSPGGKGDGGIQIGRTFSDPESDIHFTLIGKNATTPPSMDVALMRGPFPGNLPPTVTLNASATAISPGGSITFTANATDPNGDPLAYQWDFSDGYVSPNAAVMTRSFPSTGQQTLCLTVSDMKGGIVRAHVVVTIGSPGRGVVKGRITNGALPVVGVLVTSDTNKYCYSDSNGDYALSDLTTGSRTITAARAGYTFTAGFTNPVTVTATTINGCDWSAASVPEVTITATDAAEGGANGSFVISRTGETSAALTVTVAPATGIATKTTDYTFTPDYATSGSMRTFTIPAGQASLTVSVAAVNDAIQEGPETVQLQLAAGTGYQVRSQGVATLVIADDDTTKPIVSIAASDLYANEAPGDTGTFVITRTGDTAASLTATVAYSGTATRGSDYPNLPTTVTIPAGQKSAQLSLVPTNDTAIETPETCIVTVSAAAAYIVDSTASSATVTIADDDLATVTVTALDDTLNEAGRDPGVVLITRTGNLSQSLKVYYGLSGRALHGTDYIQLPGEVTIPAGAASVPVVITPYDDVHGEIDESITFNLTTFNDAYTLGVPFSATLTIKDNADKPLITVSANSAAEPSTNGTFTFQSNGSVTGSVTVHYTLSGTATAGVDYTAPSGTVTINGNGSNTATVSIPIINDAIAENTETIVLTITPDPAYVVYNDGTASMRLKDDDAPGIAVSTHSATLAEPSSASSFYLSREGTTGALTVNYTLSGTATNGTDYQTLSGTATIADGQTGVDIPVTPIDDALAEGTETVTLTLAPGAGYGIEVASGTLYLNDNDSGAMASVGFASATGTTSENPDPTTGEYRDIEVTLSAASAQTVTAEYSAGGGGSSFGDDVDWTFVDAANGNAPIARGIVTFPPGSISQMVRIRVKNDSVVEGTETAVLELRNVNGARLSTSRNKHTLTINDANNPVPRVRFIVSATTRNEADGTEPMLMAVLDRAVATSASVNYTVGGTATQGQDYNLPPGTLTFAPGETVKALPLTILADGVAELSETIVVTLTSPVGAEIGAVPTHTITLTDSNVAVVSISAADASIIEGGDPTSFTISRTGATNLNLTIQYTAGGTATNGSDYTSLPGTIVISSGQSSVTVPLTPTDDSTAEPDETVVVTLQSTADYTLGTASSATVTLFDNDSPPDISLLTPTDSTVAIPSGVGLMCQAQASHQTPEGPVQQAVSWSFVSGPGTAVIESPGSNTTGVTFPADGLYVIRVSSGQGTAIAQKDITVLVGSAFYPKRDVALTPPTVAGSVTLDNGSYTVTGASSGISSSGTNDGFYFVSTPITGDFDVKCRIASISNPGGSGSCRWGLMARASFAANAPYAMSFHKGAGTHSSQFRLTAGTAPIASDGTTVYTMPRWVRLTRVGGVFAAYYSADGTAWTQRGVDQTITMGTTCYVGLAITSAVQATASTAVFDTLDFTPVANIGPNVNAGPALTGSGPWNVDGTVTDDGAPTPANITTLWSTHGGAGLAAFANAAAVDTGVTFPTSGAYTLRLTANDSDVMTFDDTTANVTVGMAPIEIWRQDKFGADASNPTIAGNGADPDRDGIINLFEYGLNLDPHNADAMPNLPWSEINGGNLAIVYRRNLAATDLTYTVQGSPDLANWSTVTVNDSIVSENAQTRIIRSTLASPPGVPQYFLRLSINLATP
jgi:Calx-beta domain/PKD domain